MCRERSARVAADLRSKTSNSSPEALATALALSLGLLGCARAYLPEPLVGPLETDRPAEEIGLELDDFVPGAMRRAGVPGLSVAIVREGEVVLERGYGVRSAWTRRPVTTDTVFEVASNSKMVTAYAAMKLVGTGGLELDSPLAAYLDEPFLPPVSAARGAGITLRHVLTHRSGLINEPSAGSELIFDPGERFSYSGQGFLYAAEAIEDVVGEPFEEHVAATILAPLGMDSSGFGAEPQILDAMASPHVSVTIPWVLSLIVALVVGALLMLASLVIRRVRKGSWRGASAGRPLVIAALAGSAVFLPMLSIGNAVRLGLVSGAGFAALALVARLIRTDGRGRSGRRWRRLLAAAVLVIVGWALLLRPPVPLEMRPPGSSAAAGLRATAGDLALFLDELMDPRRLDPNLAAQMLSPQVEIGDRVNWGLGVGLQPGDEVDAIWHWGVNYPGYQSLVVGFPEDRIGVVVLTNGGPASFTSSGMRYAGLELAREIAFRAIGGEHYGYWNEVR